jgi:hypothetical protein
MILQIKELHYGDLTVSVGPVDEQGNYTHEQCIGIVYTDNYIQQVTQGGFFATLNHLFLATTTQEIDQKLNELQLPFYEPPIG